MRWSWCFNPATNAYESDVNGNQMLNNLVFRQHSESAGSLKHSQNTTPLKTETIRWDHMPDGSESNHSARAITVDFGRCASLPVQRSQVEVSDLERMSLHEFVHHVPYISRVGTVVHDGGRQDGPTSDLGNGGAFECRDAHLESVAEGKGERDHLHHHVVRLGLVIDQPSREKQTRGGRLRRGKDLVWGALQRDGRVLIKGPSFWQLFAVPGQLQHVNQAYKRGQQAGDQTRRSGHGQCGHRENR